jgi:hypothetical protein
MKIKVFNVINVACRFIGFVLDFSVTVKNWERMNGFVTLANSFLGIYNCVVNIMKLSKYKIVSLFYYKIVYVFIVVKLFHQGAI